MRDIKDIRLDIDKVDSTLKELFLERLNLSKEIAEFKKKNNLPICDKSREEEIIKNRTSNIGDLKIKELYTEFLNNMFSFSKKYQESINQ